MDDIVLKGMAKWPNVPAVFGWLALDRRGQWRLKGERITNPAICAFFGRNYAHDSEGCWYLQNGPQRVYVELGLTPYIWRITPGESAPSIHAHSGLTCTQIHDAFIDDAVDLLLNSVHGIGLVHDADLHELMPYFSDDQGHRGEAALSAHLDTLTAGDRAPLWLTLAGTPVMVEPIRSATLAQQFGFNPKPRQSDGEPECQ